MSELSGRHFLSFPPAIFALDCFLKGSCSWRDRFNHQLYWASCSCGQVRKQIKKIQRKQCSAVTGDCLSSQRLWGRKGFRWHLVLNWHFSSSTDTWQMAFQNTPRRDLPFEDIGFILRHLFECSTDHPCFKTNPGRVRLRICHFWEAPDRPPWYCLG